MEPFEETSIKGETNFIPYCLMKIDGETLVISTLKPIFDLDFCGVLKFQRKRREKDESFGFWNLLELSVF